MADADAITEGAAKLQLDEVTGEMVSKGELKKRMKKREKATATAKAKKEAKEAAAAAGGGCSEQEKPKPKEKVEETVDVDAMFKDGFLKDVYNLRPSNNIFTRFPPEPNGFLHIGHAKAIAVNFGFARYHKGQCYLRFDDTNPEAEDEIYFKAIEDMISWLGFTPYKITYSSDSFQRLYECAEKLIELEGAYVCHCNDDEIKLQRGGEKGASPRFRCAHAEQSVEENLEKFRAMKAGEYRPREAFLRMRQDITDGNPQMWDLAAYRVLDKPHHRTGDAWKIYPTYDFTHCLCDSFENITHSLCTTEFILSRVSYEWLNNKVAEYQPMQREYGRLALEGTVLSKRKILKLVDDKIVRGWDDPRLYTLIGLRRRGIPPQSLLEFVNQLGVTTATTNIQIKRFEQSIRKYLERTVPRLMLVLDPVPVVIDGGDELAGTPINAPFAPKDPSMGSHEITFSATIYVDRSDFKEEADPSFFRLSPGKTVGLLNVPYPIKVTGFSKDENGKVTEIRAVFDKEGKKPKTYIQFVPKTHRKVEVRIHERLFKSDNPNAAEGGFLNDINPDSETVYPNAIIETGFEEVKRRGPWPEAAGESGPGVGGLETVRFQGLRVGYFAVDNVDSTDDHVTLNRIVALKEDAGKS